MFDFVRNNTRLALGFMLLLIIPSFVFFGIDGYKRFTDGTSTTVAKVDGLSITRGEWESMHQRVVDRARRQNPEQESLDTPALRRETLDNLVRDRVLIAAANKLHLAPTDDRLRRLFAADPQYAQIRNPDGSVNRELLAMQGMSSEGFAQSLRQDMAVQQLIGGLTRSAFAPAAIASAGLDPLLQRREVQLQRFDPAIYRAQQNMKTRMTTDALPHEGLGVAYYAWSSSPLRRYVDLVNQRQLVALIQGGTPLFPRRSPELNEIARTFDLTYDAYAEFQRNMERFWCLRYLEQEGRTSFPATVIRDELVRGSGLPIIVRLKTTANLAPKTAVTVNIESIDYWSIGGVFSLPALAQEAPKAE